MVPAHFERAVLMLGSIVRIDAFHLRVRLLERPQTQLHMQLYKHMHCVQILENDQFQVLALWNSLSPRRSGGLSCESLTHPSTSPCCFVFMAAQVSATNGTSTLAGHDLDRKVVGLFPLVVPGSLGDL